MPTSRSGTAPTARIGGDTRGESPSQLWWVGGPVRSAQACITSHGPIALAVWLPWVMIELVGGFALFGLVSTYLG